MSVLSKENQNEDQNENQQQQQQKLKEGEAMTSSSSSSSSSSSVQVYVRVRPLIKEEEGHEMMDFKIINKNNVSCCGSSSSSSSSSAPKIKENENEEEKRSSAATSNYSTTTSSGAGSSSIHVKLPSKERTMNPAFQQQQQQRMPPPRLCLIREDWKMFGGFNKVFHPKNDDNESVYKVSIQPLLLPNVITNRQSVCIFTYGHTGSGKTHTLLGYSDKDNSTMGVYKHAARDIFHHLNVINNTTNAAEISNDDHHQKQQRVLLIRITELYKDMARDLLTGDQCTIREDKKGVAHIRGPIIEDEQGRSERKPLGKICRTLEEVSSCVDAACKFRRVGTSTHHDQSSRSHLVIEMEIVTPELVQFRNELISKDAHLARLGWLQTERMFRKRKEDHIFPKWTDEYTASPMKLRGDMQTYEKLVHELEERILMTEINHNLGGTLVFCDLAGNEYARDAAGSTKEEMEEAAEINKSLLAVKEMIRSLNHNNTPNKHVPYRDSKLSMMLKRHLQQDNNNTSSSTGSNINNGSSSRAVMMGHISPSQEYIRKTINTLTYCSMVGNNNNNNNTNNKNNKNIKNNKIGKKAATANNKTGVKTATMEKGKENKA